MFPDENPHLDVCQNIEFVLKMVYESNPNLTDNLCMLGLDNAKIAIKQEFGFAKSQKVISLPELQPLINGCVEIGIGRIDKVNNLSLKEYVSQLERIRKSVKLHSSHGARGYYEFIKKFM